jgi:hypothetical protein
MRFQHEREKYSTLLFLDEKTLVILPPDFRQLYRGMAINRGEGRPPPGFDIKHMSFFSPDYCCVK